MTSFFSFSFFSVPSCQKRCERNQQADGSTAARASSSSRERWPGISKALISINRQFDGWGLSISGFPPVRPTSFTILSSTVLLSRTLLLSSRARAREEEDCGADKNGNRRNRTIGFVELRWQEKRKLYGFAAVNSSNIRETSTDSAFKWISMAINCVYIAYLLSAMAGGLVMNR